MVTDQIAAILNAWHIYLHGDQLTRDLIKSRMEICGNCVELRQFSIVGQLVLKGLYLSDSSYKCARCSCHLEAKAADPNQHCPIGKW